MFVAISGFLFAPVDITISNFDSNADLSCSSTMDAPLTPTSCFSDSSSYMETNLDDDDPLDTSTDHVCHVPQRNYLNPNAKAVSPQQKQRFKDRKLVRQKSCDYDSPPVTEDCVQTKGKLLLAPCQKYSGKVSQSQPSLLITGLEAHKCSKVNLAKHSDCPSPRRLNYLRRSKSSGAEKARLRDRYCSGASPHKPQQASRPDSSSFHHPHHCHHNPTKDCPVLHPLSKDLVHVSHSQLPVKCAAFKTTSSCTNIHSSQLNRSSTCDSQSYDNDCSTMSDWTGDESACDEEVRKITGDDTDEDGPDDDILDSVFSPDIPGERTLLLAEAPEDDGDAALSSTPSDTSCSIHSMIDSWKIEHQVRHCTNNVCHNNPSSVPCDVSSTDRCSPSNSHHSNHPSRRSDNPLHHSNSGTTDKCNGGQTSVFDDVSSSGEPLIDFEQSAHHDSSDSTEQSAQCDRSNSTGQSSRHDRSSESMWQSGHCDNSDFSGHGIRRDSSNFEQGVHCDSSDATGHGVHRESSASNTGGDISLGMAKLPVIHFDDPLHACRRRKCSTHSEDGEC